MDYASRGIIRVYDYGEEVDVSSIRFIDVPVIDLVNTINKSPGWRAQVIYDRLSVKLIYKSKPTLWERLRGCFVF